MKLDWSIPVWQVLTAIWLVFVFFFTVVRKLDTLLAIFKEYPPHRHIAGVDEPLYPRGMNPDGD